MHNSYDHSHVQRLQAAAARRLNNFHGPKRQLLGNKAVPAPAWKMNAANGIAGSVGTMNSTKKGKEIGSRILLSRLPVDVTAVEVEELFKKTVGPLKDMFLVYNNQGKSKGMAVVTFTRPEDAVVARQKFDGKIVDGRRPIKIEIIYDGIPGAVDQKVPAATPTLLNRLGAKLSDTSTLAASPTPQPTPPLTLQQRTQQITPNAHTIPPRRVRFKKGPKRLKKQHLTLAGTVHPGPGGKFKKGPVSKDDLDKEMEDYRAAAPSLGMAL